MTPKEFFCAWDGFNEQKKTDLSSLFHIAQYNAMRTAFSEEQQKSIQNDSSPWEEKKVSNGIPVDEKIGSFIRRQERKYGRT